MESYIFSIPNNGLVLLGGRPGIGKTCVLLELAMQYGDSCTIICADEKHNSTFVQNIQSNLPTAKIVADKSISTLSAESLKRFIESVASIQSIKAILLDSVAFSTILSPVATMSLLKETADKLGIVIIAECPINRNVETHDDKRPTIKDILYPFPSADGFISVYRDSYYDMTDNDNIEIRLGENDGYILSFKALQSRAGY